MGLTFEQQYGDVLDEFVEYLNGQPKIIRLDFLEEAKDEFINIKMKRWGSDDEKDDNGRDK